MAWLDTKRVIRSGATNFRRNGVVSLASVLVMTITLSVILSLVFLQVILNYSLLQIKDKVDVTIYFVTDAPEDKILSLQSDLEKLPEVASISYTSAEVALAQFREKYASDYLTIQALDELGENPLGGTLNIKARETSQYESISNFLEDSAADSSSSIIDKVDYQQNKLVIDRLSSIIDGAKILGFLVTLVLIIISLIITFNTIRLTIFISREEIGIMRLVGASNKYIRGPFLVEGALYGVISSVVALILFYPFSYWLGKNLTGFFGINMLDYYVHNILSLFLIVLASGVILGMISSLLAVRRYLNK